jgi:hypothetical protein
MGRASRTGVNVMTTIFGEKMAFFLEKQSYNPVFGKKYYCFDKKRHFSPR